jgi:hypothetical protein
MTVERKQKVIAALNGRSMAIAFEAAKTIGNDRDKGVEQALIQTLSRGRRAFNRAAAAYALRIVTATPRVIKALERTVSNNSENPRVRGEAAGISTCASKKIS